MSEYMEKHAVSKLIGAPPGYVGFSDGAGGIIAGHGRILAAQKLGIAEVPVMVARGWTKAQKQAYILADNKLALSAGWDDDLLRVELAELKDDGFNIDLTGFSAEELAALLTAEEVEAAGAGIGGAGSLADRFGVPPFSVLNAREGWWQDRKRAWLALGIKSELGRGEDLAALGGAIERREAIKRNSGGGSDASRSGKATPGGSMMPACDYSKRQRGDGRGRPVA